MIHNRKIIASIEICIIERSAGIVRVNRFLVPLLLLLDVDDIFITFA